jgi:hypothetical protein
MGLEFSTNCYRHLFSQYIASHQYLVRGRTTGKARDHRARHEVRSAKTRVRTRTARVWGIDIRAWRYTFLTLDILLPWQMLETFGGKMLLLR